MQFKSVNRLLKPLIKGGKEWQFIDINGNEEKPKFFFSDIQWITLIVCIICQFHVKNGLSREVVGYIMSAFSISVSLFMSLLVSIFDKFENTDLSIKNSTESVSLFMSLLVSIFDKFENTDLSIKNSTEEEEIRLIQKKNFFKRFISITSYLVVLSIFIISLCSLTYFFNTNNEINYKNFTIYRDEIDLKTTLKNIIVLFYRIILYYFLLIYLFLTLFVAGSAYEYYISEIDRRKIK